MAGLSKDAGGGRRIQFTNGHKRRQVIRLGKMPLAAASEFRRYVESLNWAMITNSTPDVKTAQWLNDLDPLLYEKLVRVGLAAARQQAAKATIGGFIDFYLEKRVDLKPSTRTNLLQVRKELVLFFGEDRPLADVTEGEAEDWRAWLSNREEKLDGKTIKSKLGPNTVRRHCGRARQIFRAAMKRRLIASNPFGEMKGISVQANKAREFFVTREMAAKVLEACPDTPWRLIFALARFGGLRTPSESLVLRWCDVHWPVPTAEDDKDRAGWIRITSSKTEHHEGKGERIIPMFEELKPFLDAAWDEATEEDGEFVITRYRGSNANLRTQLERIIRAAGLTPWPKLFQNLRSTRETELADRFPIHAVCQWLGNSQAVAKKHYLQVTGAHFKQAAFGAGGHVAYNPSHQPSATSHNRAQPVVYSSLNSIFLGDQVPPVGLEPTT